MLAALGLVVVLAALREHEVSTSPAPQTATPHRYDIEYPVMNYSGAPRTDPVARLGQRLDRGAAELKFDDTDGRGYLASLLDALGIDPASQLLVFSRTSVQIPYISSETPRAIYYTDDVYVAWPPGAPEIEIAAMDPNLGPVFYTLQQVGSGDVRFEREMDECLRCHDSYSLTGGGVPRYILGSGFTNDQGYQVTHEGWNLVDDRTPLEFRWGGWYVTGTHGDQTHMGNWVIRDPEELRAMDLARTGNVTDLGSLIDTGPYIGKHSDIVALMLIDHQTRVQNLITRVNYQTRMLLGEGREEADGRDLSPETLEEIRTIAEPLVEALLMVDEAGLTSQIEGTSGFAGIFEQKGPFDAEGRTLRELDLSRRLFRYPCSYLIYSEAFDALPSLTRRYVLERLRSILTGEDQDAVWSHLSADDRRSIFEILQATKPGFPTLGSP